MFAVVFGVDQQFARVDFLLQERQHGGFVFFDGDGRGEAVFEKFAEIGGGNVGGHCALPHAHVFRHASGRPGAKSSK